jgi:hypothetical protein
MAAQKLERMFRSHVTPTFPDKVFHREACRDECVGRSLHGHFVPIVIAYRYLFDGVELYLFSRKTSTNLGEIDVFYKQTVIVDDKIVFRYVFM